MSAHGDGDNAGGLGRLWPLLLPGAYLLHLAEEAWGGPGLARWLAARFAAGLTEERFLAINAVAWPAMLVASLAASYLVSARWLVVPLAAILLANGALHLGATLVTASYSPGVVSGVVVYLPLGALALRRGARGHSPARVAAGVGLGLAAHALVALLALASGAGGR